jgi:tRNA(Ile)-lysidine synthase
MMEILEEVSLFIHQNELLNPGEKVLVGVSGGADSLCLLDCLHRLGYEVFVGHLDHQLREGSSEEAEAVRRMAADLGLHAVIGREDVQAVADQGHSLEEAGRLVRYRFLIDTANEFGIKKIATGHTSDDQVETVLMHFLRGSGPSGLAGIRPMTNLTDWVGFGDGEQIKLIRPLLSLDRAQTTAYCEARGLQPAQDPSNLDETYFRNRIRHELIPILEGYNPAIRQVIRRTAEIMAGEAELIQELLAAEWDDYITEEADHSILFSRDVFLERPLGLQRAFLRAAIQHCLPDIRDLGFGVIERSIHFLSAEENDGRIPLVGGLVLHRYHKLAGIALEGEGFHFSIYPQLTGEVFVPLDTSFQVPLDGGWALEGERVSASEGLRAQLREGLEAKEAVFDIKRMGGGLKLRTILPGDRIRLLGMKGRCKVSELYVNEKVPRGAREHWPLLVDGEDIIWVVGIRSAHSHRVTPETEEVLRLSLKSPGGDGHDPKI